MAAQLVTYFPHIFDSILSYADDSITVRTPFGGGLPCLRSWANDTHRAGQALPPRLEALFAHVEVVDYLCGPNELKPVTFMSAALFSRRGELRAVRLRSLPDTMKPKCGFFFASKTIVHFLQVRNRRLGTGFIHLCAGPSGSGIAAHRVTYHIEYDPTDSLECAYLDLESAWGWPTARQVVVIFQRRHSMSRFLGFRGNFYGAAHPNPLGVLGAFVPGYCQDPRTTFTFVGLESLPLGAVPALADHDDWEERKFQLADLVTAAMMEYAASYRPQWYNRPLKPSIPPPPSLAFLTRDGYEAQVGREQALLETVPPPLKVGW